MPPRRPRDARVAFAQAVAADEAETPIEELRQLIDSAIVAGTAVERYGRVWRMGQARRDAGVIYGRIGYQRQGDLADIWDDHINDFVEQRLQEGLASPFALNETNLVIAFQLRAGRIKPNSFIGAFQALLNESSGETIWAVRPIYQGVDWEQWRASAIRVRHIELKLERPNPNYHGRNQVEQIVEGARARLARVIFDADDPAGLDIDDPLIREAIEHARADYGAVKAVGDVVTDGAVHESVWRSDVEGSPIETKVRVNPETREVYAEALGAELPRADAAFVDQELREQLVAPRPEPPLALERVDPPEVGERRHVLPAGEDDSDDEGED